MFTQLRIFPNATIRKFVKISVFERKFSAETSFTTNSHKSTLWIALLPTDVASYKSLDVATSFNNLILNGCSVHCIKHPNFKVLCEAVNVHQQHFTSKEVQRMVVSLLSSPILQAHTVSEVISETFLRRLADMKLDFLISVHKLIAATKQANRYRARTEMLWAVEMAIALRMQEAINSGDRSKMAEVCMECLALYDSKESNYNFDKHMLPLIEMGDFQQADIERTIATGTSSKQFIAIKRRFMDLWYALEPNSDSVIRLLKSFADGKDATALTPKFVQYCTHTVISARDRDKELELQMAFDHVGIISTQLIANLSMHFNDSVQQCNGWTMHHYYSFVRACHAAKCIPANWKTQIVPMLGSLRFDDTVKDISASLVILMHEFGHYNAQLTEHLLRADIEKYKRIKLEHIYAIICDQSVLETISNRGDISTNDKSTLTSTNYMELHTEFQQKLERLVGVDKALLMRSKGLIFHYLLKMDMQTGDFLPITAFNEELAGKLRNHEILIGVRCYNGNKRKPRRKQVLKLFQEKYGMLNGNVCAIVIDSADWDTSLAYERAQDFYTKLHTSIKSLKIK